MLPCEVAADAFLVALAIWRPPRYKWAWRIVTVSLLLGDSLYYITHNWPDLSKWMFPLEESVFTAYVIAACWFLSRSFFSSPLRLEKVERYILMLLWGGLLYVSGRYLLLPFFQSGNYATPFYYINSTLFRFAETAVLALAMFMSLKTLSLHWLYLTQGIALLSISSIALGYNDGVLLGSDVPFHEYGWFWGLLMILFAQTFRASSEVVVSKWSSVRVRMAGLIFIFNLALLFVLYALRIFTTHNAFQLTSMLFIVYGLWFVASLISYQLSANIQEVLENIQAGPAELTPFRPRWNVYEVELLADKLSIAYSTIKKQSRLAALTEIAAQVAHDIRSPLAALNVALQDMSALPEKRQELARGALGRIGEIARDLLDNYKKPGAVLTSEKPASPQNLKCLIEPIISEKRAQYASKSDITIEFSAAATENIKAAVQPAEFRRIISNLVNNAIEAFKSGGRVTIELAIVGDKILLKIGDTGKGIPAVILARLGQKGETHGKAGGTGLGLYHARTSVEGWGGKLDIQSVFGRGTTVSIELPVIAAAQAPVSHDAQVAGRLTILVDDDALVRMNWKTVAKAKGISLKIYSNPKDFLAEAGQLVKETIIYLDSDLGNGVKGEDISKELHEKGFADITLETGHPPEQFAHLPWLKITGKEPPWQG